MWLLIAAIILLLFIWISGEVADRLPEHHGRKRNTAKRR